MAKKHKKKKNRSFGTKIAAIVCIVVVLGVLADILKQLYGMFALQRQAEVVEEQLQAIKDENASLISTKEKLEDPEYIQTYARGEYMFSKGDEKVFYLPGN